MQLRKVRKGSNHTKALKQKNLKIQAVKEEQYVPFNPEQWEFTLEPSRRSIQSEEQLFLCKRDVAYLHLQSIDTRSQWTT